MLETMDVSPLFSEIASAAGDLSARLHYWGVVVLYIQAVYKHQRTSLVLM